jgi:hypothetical protein
MSRAERRNSTEFSRRTDPRSEELFSNIAMHLDRLAPLLPNQSTTIRTGQTNTSLGLQGLWIERFELKQRKTKEQKGEPRQIVTRIKVIEPFQFHHMAVFFPAGTSQSIDGLVTEIPPSRFGEMRFRKQTGRVLQRERERFQRTGILTEGQKRTNELSAKLLQILAEFEDGSLVEESLYAETSGIDNNLELLKLMNPLIDEVFGPITQQEDSGEEPRVKALIAKGGDAMLLQTRVFQLPRYLRLIDSVFGAMGGEKIAKVKGMCRELHAFVKDESDPSGKTQRHYHWIDGTSLLTTTSFVAPDAANGEEQWMSFFLSKINGEVPSEKLDEIQRQELFEIVRRIAQEHRSK